jgi:branched-chain amino acid transport system permease protein
VFLQLLVSGLVMGSIYGLIALGYSLIYKASGLMSFVQGDLMTLGAFVGLTFYDIFKLPYLLSVLLTVIFAFFLGILIEKGVIRKLLDKNVMPIYVVLATIAISYLIQNGSQLVWGTSERFFPSVFKTKIINIFTVRIQTEALLCIVVSFLLMLLLHYFMTKTNFGTSMRAATMNPKAAESCGINVSKNIGITWGLTSGIAAIAGILLGPIYSVYTTLGAMIGSKGFTSAVFGGYGNMYGAMVGGLLLGVTETMVTGYISSAYKNLIAYILLIVFLFIKPTGIFNEAAIKEL